MCTERGMWRLSALGTAQIGGVTDGTLGRDLRLEARRRLTPIGDDLAPGRGGLRLRGIAAEHSLAC